MRVTHHERCTLSLFNMRELRNGVDDLDPKFGVDEERILVGSATVGNQPTRILLRDNEAYRVSTAACTVALRSLIATSGLRPTTAVSKAARDGSL